MENTQPINSVNQNLLEYNNTKSLLADTRDLLARTTAELNVLREQVEKNKVIVIETVKPGKWGQETISKLKLDIDSPETSEKILEVISKVETSELENKVEEKKVEITNLKDQIERLNDVVTSLEFSNRRSIRSLEEQQEDKIHKINRKHDEELLAQKEKVDDLNKALADLKEDKTKEQIEIAHIEELEAINEKLSLLENFRSEINEYSRNPFKLMRFIASARNASNFIKSNPWYSKLRDRAENAKDRIESFAKTIANVGKTPEKEVNNNLLSPYIYYGINPMASSW